jgi:hypothetical protein
MKNRRRNMRRPNGHDILRQLIRAYEKEATLYAGLETAAAEQQYVLLNGRDPERLDALVERQRRLAEDIGKIEAGIAPLRQHWESNRDAVRGPQIDRLAQKLDALLEALALQIHHIVEIEKENSEALLLEPAPNRIAP